ncbi:MAG: ATP-binding protein [Bacteroidota bacterium]|jgi:serine/threonine-protein kinase RsbW|nr:ATP-binding protein [Bacteroidota bacterium]MCA6442477.1 ATP-binding protein [Bacteroidota bacterium]
MIPAKGEHIKISSTNTNIRLVEKLIDDVCQVYKVNEDSYGNILIAVTEAVNNAIQHGNQNNPEKFVEIGFNNVNQLLTFNVSDEGNGFNYNALPDPTDPANIDKPHGRGIFLMRNLADSVEFLNNGKTVMLSFKN